MCVAKSIIILSKLLLRLAYIHFPKVAAKSGEGVKVQDT